MSTLNILLIFFLSFNFNITDAYSKSGFKFPEKKIQTKPNPNTRAAFINQFWL